ncbi:hypothetical protein, partial [Streptococcus pneumoniae]|uniref:hypothetical protein n=1 Tax=Streptococcus pneumoniae TaxID=1313 RepID=UPI001E30FE28
VAEDVAQDVVQAAGFHIKQLSAPMLVHVVRLMQAKKMCTTKPSGLHLRALASEASREPSPKIAAQEEAAWALLGVTHLD